MSDSRQPVTPAPVRTTHLFDERRRQTGGLQQWLVAFVPALFRDRRLTIAWFASEAVVVVGFWVTLLLVPGLRPLFGAVGAEDRSLLAFGPADLTIVASSLIAAAAARKSKTWSWIVMLLTAATSTYPVIYSATIALTGGGAEMAVALMFPMAILNWTFTIASRTSNVRVGGRVARRASTRWNLVKTAGEIVFMWTVFLWLIPTFIRNAERRLGLTLSTPPWSEQLALVLFSLGTALMIWAAYAMAKHGEGTPFPFDQPRKLVLSGPYAFVRNPQAIGILGEGLGLLMSNWSLLILAYLLGGIFVWQVMMRPWEEGDLASRFGSAFDHYRVHVSCWIPRLSRYSRFENSSPGSSTEEAPNAPGLTSPTLSPKQPAPSTTNVEVLVESVSGGVGGTPGAALIGAPASGDRR